MTRPNYTRRRKEVAFTTMELLLVVALVVFLLAISFVGFKKLRLQADNTRCISHLRQATAALLASAGDRNNRIESGYSGSQLETAQIWGAILFRNGYITDKRALRCPTGKCPNSLTASGWAWHTYGLNMYGPAGVVKTPESIAYREFTMNLSMVESPARYILVADSGVEASGSIVQTFRMDRRIPSGMHIRHGGKLNVCYADGHVETLDYNQIKAATSEWRLPLYENP